MKAIQVALYSLVILVFGSASAPFWLPVVDLIAFFAAAVGQRICSTQLFRIMTIPIEIVLALVAEFLGYIGLGWRLYSRLIHLEAKVKELSDIKLEMKELRQELQDFRNELTQVKTIQQGG